MVLKYVTQGVQKEGLNNVTLGNKTKILGIGSRLLVASDDYVLILLVGVSRITKEEVMLKAAFFFR